MASPSPRHCSVRRLIGRIRRIRSNDFPADLPICHQGLPEPDGPRVVDSTTRLRAWTRDYEGCSPALAAGVCTRLVGWDLGHPQYTCIIAGPRVAPSRNGPRDGTQRMDPRGMPSREIMGFGTAFCVWVGGAVCRSMKVSCHGWACYGDPTSFLPWASSYGFAVNSRTHSMTTITTTSAPTTLGTSTDRSHSVEPPLLRFSCGSFVAATMWD